VLAASSAPEKIDSVPPGSDRFFVVDDKAAETVGCLLLTCHPPEGEPGEEKPWMDQRLHWVGYGVGGRVAEGTTDD
jgi:hypothetical protein